MGEAAAAEEVWRPVRLSRRKGPPGAKVLRGAFGRRSTDGSRDSLTTQPLILLLFFPFGIECDGEDDGEVGFLTFVPFSIVDGKIIHLDAYFFEMQHSFDFFDIFICSIRFLSDKGCRGCGGAPIEILGKALSELHLKKRIRTGVDLQFCWDDVDAFARQSDGSLFSWCERYQRYQHLIYGIVNIEKCNLIPRKSTVSMENP